MNRLTMTFIVLAAAGGCMAVNRDPMDDYNSGYGSPRYQSPTWPPATQTTWRGPNGQPVQANQAPANSPAWGSQTYGSSSGTNTAWSNPPQNSTTAKSYTATASAKTTTTAAKTSKSPSPPKYDDKIVRTALLEKTSGDSDSGLLSASAGPKGAAKSSALEAKSPPINLGVLRLLNSKHITFHYEVKDPASVGVSAMELWGTTDNTRTWKKYDIVTRTPSSLVVDVKDEGVYGFTMIARGKGELAKNQPPQAGEPPQVWLVVDLTKPVVQLLGAELNVMSQTPALVVRWSAKDQHFGPRPITLLYADRVEGMWSPIAANVENNGRYEWVMPSCVPANVLVRVQATDLMGNASMVQTTTLHIPGRSANSGVRGDAALAEPPRMGAILPQPSYEPSLRPVAAVVPNPAVSILSVDNGD